MGASIRYHTPEGEVVVPLEGDEIVIGRGRDSDVVIHDSAISRKHARLFRRDDRWRVVDLGSKNGTRINDLPGTDKALEDGDTIYLHEIPVAFVDDSAPALAPSPLRDGPTDTLMQTVFRSTVDFSELASLRPEGETADRAPLDRLQRLLAIVTEASEAVLTSSSLDDLYGRMLDLVFRQLPVERGFIMLWDDARRDLVTKCVKHLSHRGAEREEIRFSRTIAHKVYQERVAVLARDAQVDERFASGQSIMDMGIRSAMAAPLWNRDKVEGLIYVDSLRRSEAFDDFDLDLLSALGNHLAVALERERLQRVALEKEKLDRELVVAREIQMSVLPRRMPRLAGYDLAGTSRPAAETGGDIFDVVPLDDHRLVLLLGDATGHGVGPALSVTQVRAMLRIALRLGADLDAAFSHINDQLEQDLASNRFVTAFLGTVDNRTHRALYHAGGQGPILHYRAASGGCAWHAATTTPMGFMPVLSLDPPRSVDLAPGDILGLITDGVFECENEEGEQFGTAGVERVVRENAARPAPRLVELLLHAVDEFAGSLPQADDITIVLLRRE